MCTGDLGHCEQIVERHICQDLPTGVQPRRDGGNGGGRRGRQAGRGSHSSTCLLNLSVFVSATRARTRPHFRTTYALLRVLIDGFRDETGSG